MSASPAYSSDRRCSSWGSGEGTGPPDLDALTHPDYRETLADIGFPVTPLLSGRTPSPRPTCERVATGTIPGGTATVSPASPYFGRATVDKRGPATIFSLAPLPQRGRLTGSARSDRKPHGWRISRRLRARCRRPLLKGGGRGWCGMGRQMLNELAAYRGGEVRYRSLNTAAPARTRAQIAPCPSVLRTARAAGGRPDGGDYGRARPLGGSEKASLRARRARDMDLAGCREARAANERKFPSRVDRRGEPVAHSGRGSGLTRSKSDGVGEHDR